MTRKKTITASLTIHDFVCIQWRNFGRTVSARLPSRRRMIGA
jgi:hypothetical protein